MLKGLGGQGVEADVGLQRALVNVYPKTCTGSSCPPVTCTMCLCPG